MLDLDMPRTLTTFETTMGSDGRLEAPAPFPIKKGTRVIITFLEEAKTPNTLTQAAMEEPIEGQGHETLEALMADLES